MFLSHPRVWFPWPINSSTIIVYNITHWIYINEKRYKIKDKKRKKKVTNAIQFSSRLSSSVGLLVNTRPARSRVNGVTKLHWISLVRWARCSCSATTTRLTNRLYSLSFGLAIHTSSGYDQHSQLSSGIHSYVYRISGIQQVHSRWKEMQHWCVYLQLYSNVAAAVTYSFTLLHDTLCFQARFSCRVGHRELSPLSQDSLGLQDISLSVFLCIFLMLWWCTVLRFFSIYKMPSSSLCHLTCWGYFHRQFWILLKNTKKTHSLEDMWKILFFVLFLFWCLNEGIGDSKNIILSISTTKGEKEQRKSWFPSWCIR